MSYWLLLLKRMIFQHYLFHCCAATQSCLTLCDLMDCSTPGFSVLHCLLEFAQTHVHWVNDVNKLFHPQSPLRPPALNLSKHQGLFQWIGSLHQVAKVLELQHQFFQWIFRVDFFRINWFDLLAVQGTLKSFLQYHKLKASILQCSAFFMVQLPHPHMTTGKHCYFDYTDLCQQSNVSAF